MNAATDISIAGRRNSFALGFLIGNLLHNLDALGKKASPVVGYSLS